MKKRNNQFTGAVRKSKKQVYLENGIIYNNGRILTPLGWTRELLKKGNDKTGKAVLTFSTCPGTGIYTAVINGIEYTVKGTCPCDCKDCYAKTGHYHRKTVTRSMVINTVLANDHLSFLKRAITAQIEWYNGEPVEVRIHAAGDFKTKNPDKYAGMWHDIKAAFREVCTWTYTKIEKFEPLFDDLDNANVVKSIIPGVGVNFGKCGYIMNAYNILKARGASVYICECGVNDARHCEGCRVCATYEYVLFIEHSTGYNAKNDPLYPTLAKMILSQNPA